MLLGIVGTKGSGKTAFSRFLTNLVQVETYQLNFADPMKEILRTLGFSYEALYGDTNAREQPDPGMYGVTCRKALTSLGDWGRNHINPNIWTDYTIRKARQCDNTASSTDTLVIIGDCRFLNEAAAIQRAGGQLVRVRRTDYVVPITPLSWHSSETEQASIHTDHEVAAPNLQALQQSAYTLLLRLGFEPTEPTWHNS